MFHYSDTWQLIINTGTTIVTFLMVFLIQNSQNRDGAAMQAKLDELLRAVDKAREKFIGIEHLTDQQIELVRTALERYAKDAAGQGRDRATTPSTGCSSASDQLAAARLVALLFELAIGFVDRPQQLVEMRRLLDRPDAVERRTEHIEVATREEADRHDPFRA